MANDPPPRRTQFHRGYLIAAAILAFILFFGSLALFPEWGQSLGILLALIVIIAAAVVTFLADWRTAFAPKSQ